MTRKEEKEQRITEAKSRLWDETANPALAEAGENVFDAAYKTAPHLSSVALTEALVEEADRAAGYTGFDPADLWHQACLVRAAVTRAVTGWSRRPRR